MNLKQVNTNIKISPPDWNRFRAACMLHGENSGVALANYIRKVNTGEAQLFLDKEEPASAEA